MLDSPTLCLRALNCRAPDYSGLLWRRRFVKMAAATDVAALNVSRSAKCEVMTFQEEVSKATRAP